MGQGPHSRMYRGVDTEQRRAERRERLLEAALDEFTTRGYHKTKIADLCARAGVSTRNFYEKFASKEALLLELHAHINTVAMKRMLPVLESLADADALTRITTLLDAFVAAVTSDPRYPRLNYVEAPGISQAMERQHRDWFTRYTDFIEAECDRAAAAGLAPKRDYHLTAIALVGAMTGILREWQAHDPPLPAGAVATEIREVFIAAITRPA
ncbi:TetR/AcrR family transcriptional regulator [Actinophytocola gossypii]|uniref:TetR/AcrR family transcriptional regulator n=1 Tax=Actinophytocola gossypii TaxID=2812003 RepID=A0ABT2J4G3_9PSEU|nr:TetR/AcrR family transcriptional regulator [Actinophytocola gossypii]MCT2582737.1 TetR/AcrR family transcriptional regulator [Actinophytocola gossypii]